MTTKTAKTNLTRNQVLRTIRLSSGLNQREFAEAIGCDASYISNIENDNVIVSEKRFKEIATIFDYKVNTTVEGNGQRFILS